MISFVRFSDACSNSRDNESSGVTTKPAESELFSILPDSSSDPQLWNNSESYEGYEPQLTLQEEDFIFSSQPRSSKWGQGQVDQEKMNTADDLLQTERQFHTHLEDDFIGSESDEVCLKTITHYSMNVFVGYLAVLQQQFYNKTYSNKKERKKVPDNKYHIILTLIQMFFIF